jgi:hypothetical protein
VKEAHPDGTPVGDDRPLPRSADLETANDFVVSNNHLHDIYREGIDAKDGSVGGMIRGNHVHGCDLGPGGPGIYIDAFAGRESDVVVDGNLLHDCSEGIAFATEQDGTLTNITFVNNIAYGNNNEIGLHSYIQAGDTPEMHVKTNVAIVSNTFAFNTGQGLRLLELPEKLPGFVIRNNIVVSSATSAATSEHGSRRVGQRP